MSAGEQTVSTQSFPHDEVTRTHISVLALIRWCFLTEQRCGVKSLDVSLPSLLPGSIAFSVTFLRSSAGPVAADFPLPNMITTAATLIAV